MDPRLRAAQSAIRGGRWRDAESAAAEVLANVRSGGPLWRAALYVLGTAAARQGRPLEAERHFRTLLADAARRGDPKAEHQALHQLALLARLRGDAAAAERLFGDEAERIERSLPSDAAARSLNRTAVARLHIAQGRHAEASAVLEGALRAARVSEDAAALAAALAAQGELALARGDVTLALSRYRLARSTAAGDGDDELVTELDERIEALVSLDRAARAAAARRAAPNGGDDSP